MKTYEHDPIHPTHTPLGTSNVGITKREEFAKAAMQGIQANPESWTLTDSDIAKNAVSLADALIAELNK